AINTQNWKVFFEDVSHVEAVLRHDPSGTYENMDFETRNRYRNTIEHLTKHAQHNEVQIAKTALTLAESAQRRADHQTANDLPIHIGYYLVDEGLKETRHAIGYKQPIREYMRERLF